MTTLYAMLDDKAKALSFAAIGLRAILDTQRGRLHPTVVPEFERLILSVESTAEGLVETDMRSIPVLSELRGNAAE